METKKLLMVVFAIACFGMMILLFGASANMSSGTSDREYRSAASASIDAIELPMMQLSDAAVDGKNKEVMIYGQSLRLAAGNQKTIFTNINPPEKWRSYNDWKLKYLAAVESYGGHMAQSAEALDKLDTDNARKYLDLAKTDVKEFEDYHYKVLAAMPT